MISSGLGSAASAAFFLSFSRLHYNTSVTVGTLYIAHGNSAVHDSLWDVAGCLLTFGKWHQWRGYRSLHYL